MADYQSRILESPKRFTITEASTKCGKTFSHIWWIFREAHKESEQEGWEWWWVAPVYGQTEIAFKRIMRKVANSGHYKINMQKLTITTPRGVVMGFKSADNPNSLYGENVRGFVFDEFSRAKEEAWFALRSTITYTQGKGKFIGNVTSRNWAWKLARKAESGDDPDFDYFRVTAYDAVEAGILSLEEVERARRDLPARIFKMLYLAEFSEVDGALWKFEIIEPFRVIAPPVLNDIIISVDPSGSGESGSDEAGIVAVGAKDGEGYVLQDRSGVMSPTGWATVAIEMYHALKADSIVAEANQGWEMVRTVIHGIDRHIPVRLVNATRGKILRAEPIVAKYEQGKVHHVGMLPELEDQMTTWVKGDKSPGRIDALVHGLTDLLIKDKPEYFSIGMV